MRENAKKAGVCTLDINDGIILILDKSQRRTDFYELTLVFTSKYEHCNYYKVYLE